MRDIDLVHDVLVETLAQSEDMRTKLKDASGKQGSLAMAIRLVRGDRTVLPLPEFLRRPRVYGSTLDRNELIHYLTSSLAVKGRAFLRCTKVGSGAAWRLDAVHPDGVQFQRDSRSVLTGQWFLDGQPIERVPAAEQDWQQGRAYLLPMAYLQTPERPDGIGPLQKLQASMRGYLATERYALDLFDAGSISGGMLVTEQDISPAVAKAWQDRWVENRKLGRIPVLGNGLRYSNDVMSARDAAWVEARAFNLAEVARAYGIPPAILGSSFTGGQSLSYQNSQDNYRLLRTSCLETFTQTMSYALSSLLRPGRGSDEDMTVQFDYDGWMEAAGADDTQPTSEPAGV